MITIQKTHLPSVFNVNIPLCVHFPTQAGQEILNNQI